MRSRLRDYRRVFNVLVLAAMLIVAGAVGCFSVRFMRGQVLREINSAAVETIRVVRTYADIPGGFNLVEENLRKGGEWTDAETIIFNSDGVALVSSEAAPLSEKRLDTALLPAPETSTDSFSTLGGYFDRPRISIIYRTEVEGESYYIVSTLNSGVFEHYIGALTVVTTAMCVLVLVVITPLIGFHVRRYSEPLANMTLAAKRFGAGDFSQKVEVREHNEMGFLSSTLNEMAASLEAIEDTRKSFVSNVSHELKTPMTTIGGFVDGILDGTIPESERRRYLKIVSEEIQRLSRLVRSMLNISKYESGEVQLAKKEFDLTALTIKTVLLFEDRIENKKVDVRGLDAPPFPVNADPDLIQQVIYNLTENAVKFVDEGGYMEYSFFTENDKTHLSIRNSGSGLRRHEMNKVFDRFYKTDESRGKDTTGVGLGLSIVSSIIKLHDGDILVRSKEGEYTEFEFCI